MNINKCVKLVDNFTDQMSVTHGKISSCERQMGALNFSVKGAFLRQINALGSAKEFKIENLNKMQSRIGNVISNKLSNVLMYDGQPVALELLKVKLQRAEFEINALIKSEQEERIALNTIINEVFGNDGVNT